VLFSLLLSLLLCSLTSNGVLLFSIPWHPWNLPIWVHPGTLGSAASGFLAPSPCLDSRRSLQFRSRLLDREGGICALLDMPILVGNP
jgi:hypothetical protein